MGADGFGEAKPKRTRSGGLDTKWRRSLAQHRANVTKKVHECNCAIPYLTSCKRKGFPKGCYHGQHSQKSEPSRS